MIELIELRRLADETIHRSAIKIGCSYGHLWNVEHGRATLTESQLGILQRHYVRRIRQRLGRIASFLAAPDGDIRSTPWPFSGGVVERGDGTSRSRRAAGQVRSMEGNV